MSKLLFAENEEVKETVIFFDTEKTMMKEQYFLKGDKLHNLNGPASKEWFRNGRLRRVAFYKDGTPHKENGAAIEEYFTDGSLAERQFCIDGKLCDPYPGQAADECWYASGTLAKSDHYNNGDLVMRKKCPMGTGTR